PQQDTLSALANKRFVRGITVLIIIIGGTALAHGPLFHSQIRNPAYGVNGDPISPIWFDPLQGTVPLPGTATLAGWSCNFANTLFFSGPQTPVVLLNPNRTTTSLCVSTQDIDLSSVTGKILEFDQSCQAQVANQTFVGHPN